MLFATFKHHQSDFQLKFNDKFAREVGAKGFTTIY